jgi:predicted nucleic acid-binding protein
VGTLTTITVQLNVVRDPKDNIVLELAVSGSAGVIISGDADLLALGVYDSIPIRTPAQFLLDYGQPCASFEFCQGWPHCSGDLDSALAQRS